MIKVIEGFRQTNKMERKQCQLQFKKGSRHLNNVTKWKFFLERPIIIEDIEENCGGYSLFLAYQLVVLALLIQGMFFNS